MIEVSHLSKSYGSRPAVQDLSFTVPDGQIYGLLGPNGAGKSTIMNILTGYLAPTEGKVKVAGFRLPEQAQQAKACVGYLPEQPPLYPEMTVQEYLDFVAELKGVKHAQRKQQVLAAARRTGLEEVLPRVIRRLSKGYRQRVGIAQALLGSPEELGETLNPGSRLRATAQGEPDTVLAAVRSVPGVCKVELESAANGQVTFTAESEDAADRRAAVSRALTEAGCTVLALAAENRSLEEVFLALTEKTPEQNTPAEGEEN